MNEKTENVGRQMVEHGPSIRKTCLENADDFIIKQHPNYNFTEAARLTAQSSTLGSISFLKHCNVTITSKLVGTARSELTRQSNHQHAAGFLLAGDLFSTISQPESQSPLNIFFSEVTKLRKVLILFKCKCSQKISQNNGASSH